MYPLLLSPAEIAQDIISIRVGRTQGTNTLGLIVFACVFGAVLARLGRKGNNLLHVIGTLQEVVIGIVTIIIW